MRSHQEFKNDQLRGHLSSEIIERAPSGFTDKIMTRVSLESKPVRVPVQFFSIKIVPLVSVTVMVILTGIALLLPSSGSTPSAMPWLKIVRYLDLPAVHFNLDSLLKFNVPAYLPYLFICLLFLMFFDRGLNGLFHRGK